MRIGVKTLNISVNVLLATAFCALGFTLWKEYRAPAKTTAVRSSRPAFTRGSKVMAIPGVDFAAHELSLIVFVSTTCRYCQASIPFYNKMQNLSATTAPAHDFAFYALFPEPEATVLAARAKLKLSARAITSVDLTVLIFTPRPRLCLSTGTASSGRCG
jgi:hypothetical protein